MSTFWTIRERFLIGAGTPSDWRFLIAIVRAESWPDARRFLGREEVGAVSELSSPGLVEEALARPLGEVWEIGVTRTPSVYDQFHRGWAVSSRSGRLRSMGYDYRAMEDAGFDVS